MRAFGKTNIIGRKDMYPYYIIGDIDLYSIFIMLGIIAAVIVYRLCADRANINAKLYNFTLICALCSIVSGFVFSVLFQAIYNIKDRGAFIIDGETGATFAGGLTGGAATFLFVYFIFGKNMKAKIYTRRNRLRRVRYTFGSRFRKNRLPYGRMLLWKTYRFSHRNIYGQSRI